MSEKFIIEKERYSEQVIRKALYWLSESYVWSLDDLEDNWVITIRGNDDNAELEMSRLLNDFTLREQLDLETKAARRELIRTALYGIANSK
jgi:His-Xaa-Ser system protein HxsD